MTENVPRMSHPYVIRFSLLEMKKLLHNPPLSVKIRSNYADIRRNASSDVGKRVPWDKVSKCLSKRKTFRKHVYNQKKRHYVLSLVELQVKPSFEIILTLYLKKTVKPAEIL